MPVPFAINVTDFFHTGDTDYTNAFTRAIATAAHNKPTGCNILVPPGTYVVSNSLQVTSNVQIIGAGTGNTIIEVPQVPKENKQLVIADDAPDTGVAPIEKIINVFSMSSVSNVRIKDLTIRKIWPLPYIASTLNTGVVGIHIEGNSTDIIIERVDTFGCYYGFEIYNKPTTGPGGTIIDGALAPLLNMPQNNPGTDTVTSSFYEPYLLDGIARRITFTNCKASTRTDIESLAVNGEFGFHLNDCDTVTLLNCHAELQYLDGIKIPKNSRNVSIIGGGSRFNGRAEFFVKPNAKGKFTSIVGDGIDCFAGGDTFCVRDTVCEYNTGNGITIKTGFLNTPQSLTGLSNQSYQKYYGEVGNVQIVGVKCCYNNGWGLVFYEDRALPQGTETDLDIKQIPYPIGLTVLGGVFNYNNEAGMAIAGGAHITITGSIIGYNKGLTDGYARIVAVPPVTKIASIGITIGDWMDDTDTFAVDSPPGTVPACNPLQYNLVARNVVIQGVHILANSPQSSGKQTTAVKIVGVNNLVLQGCTINGNTAFANTAAPIGYIDIPILIFGEDDSQGVPAQVYNVIQENIFVINCVKGNTISTITLPNDYS